MKKQIGKLLLQSKSSRRNRNERQKRLQLENLEDRRLLAVDFLTPHHNPLIAEDVNGDFAVTALDALLVINALNSANSSELPAVEFGKMATSAKLDVSGDNALTPLDALTVINALNGEGETTPTVVFTYEFTDSNGSPLSSNTVAIGDIFQLRTSVRDTRGFSAQGINSPYLDIDFDNTNSFDVAVGEIQSLKFFVDKLDASQTSSSFTLSLNGQVTAPIGLFTAGGSPRSDTAIAGLIQSSLAALPGVGAGNVTAVVDQAASSEDSQNGVPRFNFEIRFGNKLSGQNLPTLVVDASNVKVQAGQVFDIKVAEVLAGNQSTPTAEAQAIAFADLYNFARRAEVTATQFNDIGAASQVIPLPSPAEAKLVFTIPMIARAPGVINFTPNQADNPPTTDIVSGVTVIPPSMVNYGAAFSITVVTDPTAPVAITDTLSLAEDTTLTLNGNVTVNDTKTAPRTLSVASVATIPGVTLGTFIGLVYIPPANFFGTDRITYVARDSTGLLSNSATVTINVTNVNDRPDAIDDAFTVDEETTNNSLLVLANDNGGPSEPSETLTVTAVGATSNGGIVSIAAGGGAVLYTPASGFIGTDTFTYTMTDQGGLTDTATVTVTVEATVLPRARNDAASGPEGSSIVINVLANDTRLNPNSSALLVSASNGTFGTVTINDNGTQTATDDTVTYTANSVNFYGTDTFTYVMNDTSGLGVNSTGTVTVTVIDVNDPPILANDSVNGTEDTVTTIAFTTLLANDSPGLGENAGVAQVPQTLTVTAVSALSAGGSVVLSGTSVVFTPTKDFNGAFTFTYTATDNGTPPLSGTATVTINVAAVNDNPIAGNDTVATNEDTAVAILVASLLANDLPGPTTATDEAGQTLSITGVSATSSNGASVVLSGVNVNYTPLANFNGPDTFTYTLSDGAGGTATGTVTVNVAAVNDPPVAGNDTATAFKDIPLVIPFATLLANDSAGPANEPQSLTIVAVAPTATIHGTVVLGNGTVTYTPDLGYTGPASFLYTVQDSEGAQATGTVNVTVQEFVPSIISGKVFVDETGDGKIDPAERFLGGVDVHISGTSLGLTINQTMLTLSDGSYSFEQLGPGSYVITIGQPRFMAERMDLPGSLGDLDAIDNQFTINIAQPGGATATGYNFAVAGLDANHARILDQLASRYMILNPSLAYKGLYFAVGADNSLLWSAKLDGFEDSVFTEAALNSTGTEVLLTHVNQSHAVFTATLSKGQFLRVYDTAGNSLIRVLGDSSSFNWQQINLATPPITSVAKYLDSIDEIFAQEDWN